MRSFQALDRNFFSFFPSLNFYKVFCFILYPCLFICFNSLATEDRKPAEVLTVEGQQYAVVG